MSKQTYFRYLLKKPRLRLNYVDKISMLARILQSYEKTILQLYLNSSNSRSILASKCFDKQHTKISKIYILKRYINLCEKVRTFGQYLPFNNFAFVSQRRFIDNPMFLSVTSFEIIILNLSRGSTCCQKSE